MCVYIRRTDDPEECQHSHGLRDFFNFVAVHPADFSLPIGLITVRKRTIIVYALILEMRKLAQQIKRELKTAKHCAIYTEELSRVWPEDGKRREAQIAQFARDHGLRLRFYREGFCAIFDKPPRTRSQR